MTAGVREQQDLAHWVVLAGESLAQATMHTKLRQCRGNGLPNKLGSADSAEKEVVVVAVHNVDCRRWLTPKMSMKARTVINGQWKASSSGDKHSCIGQMA